MVERWTTSRRTASRSRSSTGSGARRTAPTAGISAARSRSATTSGRRHRLGRHGDRHRGPQARRGAAGLPRRGRLGARQLARLRADAHRRRAARRAADRRLVRRRHLRRRQAGAAGARARRSAQAGARAASSRSRCWPHPQPPARPRSDRRSRCSSARSTTRRSRAFGFDERQLEIARTLAPRSYVTVPLVARGEVFGSISLVTAESGRIYGEDDLTSPRSWRGTRRRRSTTPGSMPRPSAGDARRGRSKPSATASSSSTATA